MLQNQKKYDNIPEQCRSGGMVDAADSKSAEGNLMGVRVPPSAPKQTSQMACFLLANKPQGLQAKRAGTRTKR